MVRGSTFSYVKIDMTWFGEAIVFPQLFDIVLELKCSKKVERGSIDGGEEVCEQ